MTAGLYLLAGPFQSERTGIDRLLPLWGLLTVYEFSVIGMIALLRRRDVETTGLTFVSLFFLADPVFMGDAFASTSPEGSLLVNAAAAILMVLKAWVLARVLSYPVTPWLAGWVAAALCLISLVPSFIAVSATRPVLKESLPILVTVAISAIAVPLYRAGRLGRAAAAVVAVHFVAAAIVASLPFQLELVSAPFFALSALVPWPRWGWMPALAGLYCSPLRTRAEKVAWTTDGVGGLLVASAFLFLGLGFWRNLRPAAPLATSDRGRAPVVK